MDETTMNPGAEETTPETPEMTPEATPETPAEGAPAEGMPEAPAA